MDGMVKAPSTSLLNMKPKKKVKNLAKSGDLVVIHFLDHAEDGPVFPFRVAGWVDKESKDTIELISWDYTYDGWPRDPTDSNLKRFSIVKSAITSCRVVELP